MSKLKKSELLKELTKLGVYYDGDMNYNDLYKLYLNNKKLNAVYNYEFGKGEELLIDRPSEPVKLVNG